MKKVTIKDIAKVAGVSRGTVDRVINDRGNVAAEVEKNILKIASELGYEKNLMASTLANNKEFRISIVMPDPSLDLFWAQPREGIFNALEIVKHYGIKIDFFDFNPFRKDEFCMMMENAILAKPDAILTAPTFTQESIDYMEQAEKQNIPFITINSEINHPDILCYIGQNSFNSGYLAGRLFYLRLQDNDEIIALNLGHKLSNAQHYSDKVDGLKNFIHHHNMINNPVHFYEFEDFDNAEKLGEFWKSIIKSHPKMKAIFFTNSRAYRIVNDMSELEANKYCIIGFDLISPNITLMKGDKIDFIINQNPIQQGYLGIMNFVNHFVLKKQIRQIQYLPLDIVVKENVDFYIDNVRSNIS